MAKILKATTENLQYAANFLRSGKLVSFPTETVFGLGANALEESAVEKIFLAKGRPKSDPLIVHIADIQQVYAITKMNEFQQKCFDILAKTFWPGPLTLIVTANSLIPKLITAQGEYVGIRIPSHPIAYELLKRSQIPIAAPSANRFGHISPTTAMHVYDDLKEVDNLIILDDSKNSDVGIESTVLKISQDETLSILRPGIIGLSEISAALKRQNILTPVHFKSRMITNINSSKGMDSPGLALTHYAPMIETYILSIDINNNYPEILNSQLATTVLIDFFENFKKLSNQVKYYIDLSPSGNFEEACRNLFEYLRRSELMKDIKLILLPDIRNETSDKHLAIFDRIYRAASGKFICYKA